MDLTSSKAILLKLSKQGISVILDVTVRNEFRDTRQRCFDVIDINALNADSTKNGYWLSSAFPS